MSVGSQLDIRIVEARLIRIFDSLKPNQDVFVQLVCGYDDTTEKVVGRTEVCKNGNLAPRWNQRFLCGRDSARGGKTLKFKVHVDHIWRSPVLCGEAEFGLDNLWSRATGRPQEVAVPLFKKGEQTGVLNISIALQGSPTGPGASPGMPVGYEPNSPMGGRGSMSPGGSRWSGSPADRPQGFFPSPSSRDPRLAAAPPAGGYAGGAVAERPPYAPEQLLPGPPPVGRQDARHSLAASVGAQQLQDDAAWLRKENGGHTLHQAASGYPGRDPVQQQQPHDAKLQEQQQQLREQQLREQQLREQQLRDQQLREQQLREQQQQQQVRDQQLREQQQREQQQQQQVREQQLREQQQREQQQREQQQREQQQREQQQREQQQREMQLPQQRYPTQQAGPSTSEQALEYHRRHQQMHQQLQQPEPPSERSTPQQLLAPPSRQAPEVRGGSCGWCQRGEPSPKGRSPNGTGPTMAGSPNGNTLEGKSPTSTSPAAGQSGQWWNSFIDRG